MENRRCPMPKQIHYPEKCNVTEKYLNVIKETNILNNGPLILDNILTVVWYRNMKQMVNVPRRIRAGSG